MHRARYRLAAKQGCPFARFFLGGMYLVGKGVPQDYVLAHMWFNLAASQGDPSATKGRDGIVRMLTPEQLAGAQKLAREWRPTRH